VRAPTADPRVQSRLAANLKRRTDSRQDSEALLAGKLFDDRGNRMSPSHAAKGGKRWRYYVSRALLQGRKLDPGSLARVPAAEIEKQVEDAIRGRLSANGQSIANAETSRGGAPTSATRDPREGRTERSIRMTLSLAFLAQASSKRQSKDGCREALASRV
jgi:hypothetical protein